MIKDTKIFVVHPDTVFKKVTTNVNLIINIDNCSSEEEGNEFAQKSLNLIDKQLLEYECDTKYASYEESEGKAMFLDYTFEQAGITSEELESFEEDLRYDISEYKVMKILQSINDKGYKFFFNIGGVESDFEVDEEQYNAHANDSKQTNENIITYIIQLQNSLRGANTISEALEKQIPQQQPTTNEEKSLYNNTKYIGIFNSIIQNVKNWYKELEEYKKLLQNAHIVIEEVIESFPLEARTKLRESNNPEQTYKELIEDLKNRYNSLPEKEKYKDKVIKMKKDLDEFYKSTFKK